MFKKFLKANMLGVCFLFVAIKRIIFCTIILICICCLLLCNPKIRNFASNKFWNMVATELDKEEIARQKQIENGEIVRGKDTVLIWNNLFEIGHLPDGNHLFIKGYNAILEGVIKYKKKNDKLYIYAKEGYAVIDQNNLCQIYITIPDDEYVSGYTIDSNGNKELISRYVESKNVEYLDSYNDFEKEDIKILNSLKE